MPLNVITSLWLFENNNRFNIRNNIRKKKQGLFGIDFRVAKISSRYSSESQNILLAHHVAKPAIFYSIHFFIKLVRLKYSNVLQPQEYSFQINRPKDSILICILPVVLFQSSTVRKNFIQEYLDSRQQNILSPFYSQILSLFVASGDHLNWASFLVRFFYCKL